MLLLACVVEREVRGLHAETKERESVRKNAAKIQASRTMTAAVGPHSLRVQQSVNGCRQSCVF